MEPPGPAFRRPDDKLRVMRDRRLLLEALFPDFASGYAALLPRQLDREFPIGDPLGQAFGIPGRAILTIGRNHLAERGEQADLRHAIAFYPRQASRHPRLLVAIESGLLP